jgi:putative hydrolase of the HAD superfamily
VLPDLRAVVFDLDDTLYPFRRFLLSGFAAVADELHRSFGCDRRAVFGVLARASRGPARGQEVQVCLAALQLPGQLAPALTTHLKEHMPSLRLPRESVRAIAALRRDGWRLGIVTNGSPAVQARKVAALGLSARLDAIVYAAEHGSGTGKPEPDAFYEVARRLGVPPSDTVVVGDSEACDVDGALAAGMQAVQCTAWIGAPNAETRAACRVNRLSRVPAIARALLLERSHRHVA